MSGATRPGAKGLALGGFFVNDDAWRDGIGSATGTLNAALARCIMAIPRQSGVEGFRAII